MPTKEKVYKTPIYQRKAYKAYLDRKSEDPVFVEERKKTAKEAYLRRKKEKELEEIKNATKNSN